MLLQRHPGRLGEYQGRQVIHRWSEATVDDQDIRAGGHRPELAAEQRPVVTHCDLAVDAKPDVRQALGDHCRVGVDGIATHDFVAGEQKLHLGVAMHGHTPHRERRTV